MTTRAKARKRANKELLGAVIFWGVIVAAGLILLGGVKP